MARTIATIQQTLINGVQGDAVLGPQLTSTSSVALWRLWTYVVAVCQYVLESLFDAHVAEVAANIASQVPHTLLWYVNKAKAFQYGDTLVADTDTYALPDTAKQVVGYAAATEVNNGLRIKVAALNTGVLAPLTGPQLTALTAYMALVRDACVRMQITSGSPDTFVASLNIYYDPLVLDNTGARLDGSNNTPVQQAVTAFLDNLPFNGLFVLQYFLDFLKTVPGVVISKANSVQATYGALPLTTITLEYLPDAGYMTCNIATGLSLVFIPHGPI
jgi:hypothetical protein